MSTPSDEPAKPFTAAQVEDWIYTTSRKRLELHAVATEPLYSTLRQQAFIQMSELLEEAIEEVRVLSASLREDSQVLRGHALALRKHSTELLERSSQQEQAQRQKEAEAPVLQMFKASVQSQDGDNQNGPSREGPM